MSHIYPVKNIDNICNACYAGEMRLSSTTKPLAGGIVSENANSTVIVEKCLFDGIISSTSSAYTQKLGGIFGRTDGSSGGSVKTEIKNCLSSGNISSKSPNHGHEGSIAGYVGGNITTISDAYGSATTQTYSYWISDGITTGVLSNEKLIGVGAYAYTSLDPANWVAVKGDTPQLKAFQTKVSVGVAQEDVAGYKVDKTWYGDGSASTFTLSDAGDFYGFNELAQSNQFTGKTVKLADDVSVLDLKDLPLQPMGTTSHPFAGIFDGNNKTIQGLYIKSDRQYIGMFGAVNNEVKNFTLEDSYIESVCEISTESGEIDAVASIAGRLAGKLINVTSNATVVSHRTWASGLACQAWINAVMENCTFGGTVVMTSVDAQTVGGCFGQVAATEVTLKNCTFNGTIISHRSSRFAMNVGGLAGYNTGTLNLDGCTITRKILLPDVVLGENVIAPNGVGSIIGTTSGSGILKINSDVIVHASCFADKEGKAVCYDASSTVQGTDKIKIIQ